MAVEAIVAVHSPPSQRRPSQQRQVHDDVTIRTRHKGYTDDAAYREDHHIYAQRLVLGMVLVPIIVLEREGLRVMHKELRHLKLIPH
jgi:hypothetical protein